MPGKFELYKDVHERYRFRLISENGELVLSGDGYAQKVLALDSIVSIMRSASEAAVIDLSLADHGEVIEDERDVWEEDLPESETDQRTRRKKKRRKGGARRVKGKRHKSGKKSKRGKKKGKHK